MRIFATFLMVLFTLSFTFAQHHHGNHSGHGNDSSTSHTSTTHPATTSDTHHHHDMMESADTSQLIDGFRVEPLILAPSSEDASLAFYITSTNDQAFSCAVHTPSGHSVEAIESDGTEPCRIAFSGKALESGRYAIMLQSGDVMLATSALVEYARTEDATDIYSVFVPAPSMASRGQSDVFVYVFNEGDNVHGTMSINYYMEGMQHSTDNDTTVLEHQHFDDTYMTNHATVQFPMLGEWQTTVTVNEQDVRFVLEVAEE